MKAQRLTELEGCVLGEISEKGSCTAYALRQAFLRSLTPFWSGSAGAIYPLIRRLEKRGLIWAEAHKTGRRPSKLFQLTAKGLAALRGWLQPPLPPESVGVPMDPLRSRLRFLKILTVEQRADFVAATVKETQASLEHLEREGMERAGTEGHFYRLILAGAIAMMQSRIDWLRTISRQLHVHELAEPTRRVSEGQPRTDENPR